MAIWNIDDDMDDEPWDEIEPESDMDDDTVEAWDEEDDAEGI